MNKVSKKAAVIAAIAIIPICFVLYIVGELAYGFIAERQEERELFSLYKHEFSLLNDFILDNIDGDEASFYVSFLSTARITRSRKLSFMTAHRRNLRKYSSRRM